MDGIERRDELSRLLFDEFDLFVIFLIHDSLVDFLLAVGALFLDDVLRLGGRGQQLRNGTDQLGRFEKMPQAAAETAVIRTYLDYVLELPWRKSSEDKLDLVEARRQPGRRIGILAL